MSANNRSIVPFSPDRSENKKSRGGYGKALMAYFDRTRK